MNITEMMIDVSRVEKALKQLVELENRIRTIADQKFGGEKYETVSDFESKPKAYAIGLLDGRICLAQMLLKDFFND